MLDGATFKANLKESEDKRRHDRFVFERKLAKDNEREKRKRKNRAFGGGDGIGNDPTIDTFDTISEDDDEDYAEHQRLIEEQRKAEEAEEQKKLEKDKKVSALKGKLGSKLK